MTETLTFAAFRAGPGGQIAHRIGIPISQCARWDDAQHAFSRLFSGDAEEADAAMRRVRDAIAVMSTGEKAVAYALLHALDYSRQADEFSGGGMWRTLDYVSGNHRRAIIAAILRQDGAEEANRG